MVFTHDTAAALQAAVALANSALEPRHPDHGRGADRVLRRARTPAGISATGPSSTPSAAARRPARAAAGRSRRGGRAGQRHPRRRRRQSPGSCAHDRLDWHIHAIDDEAPLAERVMVETAMAMIDVIRADETTGSTSARPTTATASCSTCRATARGATARRRAATARRSRPTARGSGPDPARRRPGSGAAPRVKTAGCSECTQCPAPLIVTRRTRGKRAPSRARASSAT